MNKISKADVDPIRQRTQFSCVSASMSMALSAHGIKVNEDAVNEVMGASPLRGASWEDALACAQYFGCRATLVSPCTLGQLKEWTDAGVPVLIAWNPEGRPWSHASLVFDVKGDTVFVADPNIPNPNETVREVTIEDFYKKWSENRGDYLVRRPAMAIEREITEDGKPTKKASATFGQSPLKTRRDYGTQEEDTMRLLSASEYEEELKEGKHETGKSVPLSKLPEELQENVKNPPESVTKLKEEMKSKSAKFERGEDVPVEDLPEEVQENVKNPPESVQKVKEEMQDKKAVALLTAADYAELLNADREAKFESGKSVDPTKHMSEEDAAEWKRQNEEHKDNFKSAAATMRGVMDYLLNSFMEHDDGGPDGVAYLEKLTGNADFAKTVAEKWKKDRPDLWNRHGGMEKAEAVGKKIVTETAKATGLRLASEEKTAKSGLYGTTKDTENYCNSAIKKLKSAATKLAKEIYAKDEETPSFLVEHGKRTGSKTAKLLMSVMKTLGPGAKVAKTAAGKRGLYGYRERTAKIALHGVTALQHQAGVIAAEMHDRRADAHERITGFLKEHCKSGKCAYSGLLYDSYPPSPVVAVKKASEGDWYKEQFVHRDAGSASTAAILEWEKSIDRIATDFLASEEDEKKPEGDESEEDSD